MIASPSDHLCPPPPRADSANGPGAAGLSGPPSTTTAASASRSRGDLDITTVPILTRQLARLAGLRPAELVIDLSGVSFLDCASARLLAGTAALLPPDRPPVLASVRPAVRRLLDLLGLPGIRIAD